MPIVAYVPVALTQDFADFAKATRRSMKTVRPPAAPPESSCKMLQSQRSATSLQIAKDSNPTMARDCTF